MMFFSNKKQIQHLQDELSFLDQEIRALKQSTKVAVYDQEGRYSKDITLKEAHNRLQQHLGIKLRYQRPSNDDVVVIAVSASHVFVNPDSGE